MSLNFTHLVFDRNSTNEATISIGSIPTYSISPRETRWSFCTDISDLRTRQIVCTIERKLFGDIIVFSGGTPIKLKKWLKAAKLPDRRYEKRLYGQEIDLIVSIKNSPVSVLKTKSGLEVCWKADPLRRLVVCFTVIQSVSIWLTHSTTIAVGISWWKFWPPSSICEKSTQVPIVSESSHASSGVKGPRVCWSDTGLLVDRRAEITNAFL